MLAINTITEQHRSYLQVSVTGTLSLISSLEKSNREFACPQEPVALTCSVNGPILGWAQPDGNTIGTFFQNNPIGHGFSDSQTILAVIKLVVLEHLVCWNLLIQVCPFATQL